MSDATIIVWHDRTDSTVHQFGSCREAAAWLWDVIGEYTTPEDLAERGLPPDGIGALCFYADEGLDDVGHFEVFVRGVEVTTNDLLVAAEGETPPTPDA